MGRKLALGFYLASCMIPAILMMQRLRMRSVILLSREVHSVYYYEEFTLRNKIPREINFVWL
jgi:hypothetical protein